MQTVGIIAEYNPFHKGHAYQIEEAKKEGVSGLKGVLIVDIKNSKFEQGAVVGKRIGKAYE